MRRAGRTTAGKQRWRCTNCNATTTNTRRHTADIKHFQAFIEWILTGDPADRVAHRYGITRRTLTRWCETFWYIQPPTHTDPHRIYDQVFIDGTYFHNKCLLVASTTTHVVAWHWCTKEDSYNYGKLLDKLAPPLVVTTDGQRGSLKVIKKHWPNTKVQRCLVHIQRNVYAYTTRKPVTPAGKALKTLADNLGRVQDVETAGVWIDQLNKCGTTFGTWFNQHTWRCDVAEDAIPKGIRPNQKWWYTHRRQRSAYKLLEKQLVHERTLFTFLNPPNDCGPLKATTNSLEGGINKQLKDLAGDHRGMFDEHQRITMDWWLYTHTEQPLPPIELAKQQDFGRVGLRTVQQAREREQLERHGPADGRPKTFDTGVDTDYNPSWGVRHGWAGR